MRDDLALVKMLEALHNRLDDLDQNSYDNTTIQFFESPHDNATLTASTLSTNVVNPSTFTWGGYVGSTYYSAGWYWNYGGTWK